LLDQYEVISKWAEIEKIETLNTFEQCLLIDVLVKTGKRMQRAKIPDIIFKHRHEGSSTQMPPGVSYLTYWK